METKIIFKTDIETWPHAICFIGSDVELKKHLEEAQVESVWFSFSRMLIKDAKQVRSELQRKLQPNQYRVSVIDSEVIGHEPQNSLLKIIEEPATGHKIIFRLATLDGLLDTILSRSVVINGNKVGKIESNQLIDWVKIKKAERLKQADAWIKKAQKDKKTGQLRTDLLQMIIGMEKHINASQHRAKHFGLMQELQDLREYLQNQGASPKYILEYLALSLPAS